MDVGGTSAGTAMNRFMDSIGFPDKLGDLYGMQLDMAIGDNMGVARNMLDLFSPLSTAQMDRMMGGFAGTGHCSRPHENYGHHWGVSRDTHYDRESISVFKEPGLRGALGHNDVMIDGKKIDVGPDKGLTPQKLESKLLTDPGFRSKVESQLGARIVLDGNADGNITLAKTRHHPMIPFHNHVHQNVGNLLGRMTGGMMGGVLKQLSQVLQSPGHPAGGPQGSQKPGGTQGAKGGPDELDAILKNPNLSFEAKLAAFMGKYIAKKQEEMEKKMEEMKNAQKKEGGHGGKHGGLGGLLRKGAGMIGGLVGGPRGAAFGDKIGGALTGQGGTGGAQGTGKPSEQALQQEFQTISQAFQRMMETMNNIMKTVHDMGMSASRLIR